MDTSNYPVLEFLQKHLAGTLTEADSVNFRYPTAISSTLNMRITAVDLGIATVEIDADPALHGN